MSAPLELRKGWCPGALRPMQSGDGLLLRVKPRTGVYSITALQVTAEAAMRFGSGEIDLTNRGNLQLRGVRDATYADAIAALDAAGLLDQAARSEAVRNIVVDPLSEVDPARATVRKLGADIEDRLVRDQRLWSLPDKFGFSISGTTGPRVGNRSADIMLAADGDTRFAIFLDGGMHVCAFVSRDGAVDATMRLALAFIALCATDPSLSRMKDAVAQRGCAELFASTGLPSTAVAPHGAAPEQPVGLLAHGGRVFAAGIGLPFGRIRGDDLKTLAMMAAGLGTNAVYTSPQRLFIFPVDAPEAAAGILAEAKNLGLITVPGDLRLAIDVCPGAPACRNATTETRRDAQRLVDDLGGRLDGVTSLHISGCQKGCARRGPASLTLVARNGRYDIVCNGGPGGAVAVSSVVPDGIARVVARFIAEPSL
jgi:precorrin-3B synthase